jgi:hypothetical protein
MTQGTLIFEKIHAPLNRAIVKRLSRPEDKDDSAFQFSLSSWRRSLDSRQYVEPPTARFKLSRSSVSGKLGFELSSRFMLCPGPLWLHERLHPILALALNSPHQTTIPLLQLSSESLLSSRLQSSSAVDVLQYSRFVGKDMQTLFHFTR